MFPRLSLLQWIVFAVFLFFYGFTVFVVTRDYYLRHPPRAAAAPHAVPSRESGDLGERMRAAVSDSASSLPDETLGSNPVLLAQEADRLFAAQRYGEAVRRYRRVLELAPDDTDARNDLGLALHYSGLTEEGLKVLREGADKAPEFQRIWLSLGFVAAQAGNEPVAREALTRARDLDPDNDIGAEAVRLLGQL